MKSLFGDKVVDDENGRRDLEQVMTGRNEIKDKRFPTVHEMRERGTTNNHTNDQTNGKREHSTFTGRGG